MAKGTGVPIQSILTRPDYTQACVFAAGTAQAFDVPTGMAIVAFSSPVDFWVRYGSTACVIPTSSTTAGTSSPELNPTIRNVQSTGTTTGISLISASTGVCSMTWYKAG